MPALGNLVLSQVMNNQHKDTLLAAVDSHFPAEGIGHQAGHSTTSRFRVRAIAAACIVAITVGVVLAILVIGTSNRTATERDFIEYWAAGTQLLHGANPYDVAATMALEQGAGFHGSKPRVTFSPPILLFLLLPLGFVGAKVGFILWSLAAISSLLISIPPGLWILNGRPQSGLHFCG